DPSTMHHVKALYKLHSDGAAIKRVAAILRISKTTVKAYLRKKPELALSDDQMMATENPVLAYQLKPVSTHGQENYKAFLQRAEYYVQGNPSVKYIFQ